MLHYQQFLSGERKTYQLNCLLSKEKAKNNESLFRSMCIYIFVDDVYNIGCSSDIMSYYKDKLKLGFREYLMSFALVV